MNKKICIIGAARSGIASAKILLDEGRRVVLTDKKTKEELLKRSPKLFDELLKRAKEPESLEFVLGQDLSPDRVPEFDAVILSPGVPDDNPFLLAVKDYNKENNDKIDVLSEVDLEYLYFPNDMHLAITGTNGKTTTTTLVGEMFKDNKWDNVFVVGNIGDSIFNHVDELVDIDQKGAVLISELSSFQLEQSKYYHPMVSLILNITPDHLDRHKTMENYIEAKAKIFERQDERDIAILNYDDPVVRNLKPPCNVYYISQEKKVNGAYLDEGMIKILFEGEELPLINVDELQLKGKHNIENVLGASLMAFHAGVDLDSIRETLLKFKGVPHRQEPVTSINGVKFINDSKATNTDAAITALEAMEDPVILIAGGYDKHEDYEKFAEKIKETVKKVFLLGETKEDIAKSLRDVGYDSFILVNDLDEAVELAQKEAVSGDTVLLSPACASWDMFDNFEERGDLFKKKVEHIKRTAQSSVL